MKIGFILKNRPVSDIFRNKQTLLGKKRFCRGRQAADASNEDLWFWSVVQQGTERQPSRGVPHLWMVEAEYPNAGQESGTEQE